MKTAELYEKSGLLQEAVCVIEKVLECEPYNEQMALRLMTLYEQTDDRSRAIRFFNEFRNRLASNLEIYPGSAITRKYEELKAAPHTAEDPPAPRNSTGSLTVQTCCIPDVPCFWMADVVGKVLAAADKAAVQQWDREQLRLLSTIQPALLPYSGAPGSVAVTPAATVQAFLQWLPAVSAAQPLTIHVLRADQMDSVSRGVLAYLQHELPAGLTLLCDVPL